MTFVTTLRFKEDEKNAVWNEIESLPCLGPRIWDLVPNEIRPILLNISFMVISCVKL